MTARAVEEVDEEVNEGVDERSMFVFRDTEAEIDHQVQAEFHQGERESTSTKSTKKTPYIYIYIYIYKIAQLPIDRVPRQLC